MKTLLLLLLVCTQVVYAQSTANLPSAPSNTTEGELPGLSWERIRSRLRVNYFNFATGPNIKKWDDNETLDSGNKDRVPLAMYHSLNVRYNIKNSFDFFLQPRVVTAMGDGSDLRPTQDHGAVMADDWDIGGYYEFFRTHSFSYGQALTVRLPYSTKSRGENIDRFYVWQNLINWAISPDWRFLNWTNFTMYDFNEKSDNERYRLLSRNLFIYTLSDKWLLQVGYELDMQHNFYDTGHRIERAKNYLKRYHSYTSFGVGYQPLPQWTILPYIRTLDERNIRNETTVLGFMIMGRVI